MGSGDQRDRRWHDEHPRRKRTGHVYWLGVAKHNNEQAYLFRKFAAYWGTNNVDHQARICHSTTVAGVANTWGYGAMTNSYNDIHNSKGDLLHRRQPCRGAPCVATALCLKAKEQNNAPCDRLRSALSPARPLTLTSMCGFRPGSDVALVWGILWHIFENGWEDKEFIRTRVWGMDQIREEVAKWTPEEVERVIRRTWLPAAPRCSHTGQQPSGHGDLVHGWHAAHQRQQQYSRLLRTPARSWRTWARLAVAPTFSVAIAMCRVRLIWVSCLIHYLGTMGFQRAHGHIGHGFGVRTSIG